MNITHLAKRSSLVLGAVGVALLLQACGAADEPPLFELATATGSLEQRLVDDTGSKWHVVRGGQAVPRTLAPVAIVRLGGATTLEAAREFFSRYAAELRTDSSLRDLGKGEEVTTNDGARVIHFAHVVPGTTLPVFERGSGVELDASGNVSFVEAGFGLDFSQTSAAPSISENAAKTAAGAAIHSDCTERGQITGTELGGYPDEAGVVHLAYRVDAEATGSCRAPVVYVDASTGAILQSRDDSPGYFDTVRGGRSSYWNDASDRKTLDVSQSTDFKWQLRTQSAQSPVETRDYRDNSVVTSTALGTWFDYDKGIAVDAHFHATRALEYFRDAHGRRGLDGLGGLLRVYIHDNSSGNYYGDNATYSPRDASIHLGDGNAATNKYLPMALSFDVVAHEISHGVIAHTSRLVYERESGALNESFADVMAMSAKMWAPETRENATFKLGENSVNRTNYGRPFIRNILSPDYKIDGGYTSYRQIKPCEAPNLKVNDACWVHSSSGIGNRAFAMMAVGGDEVAQTGARIAVPAGIGFRNAAYVWYQSLTTLSNPRATFRDAAIAQLKVAERISPAARTAVGCAWAAVDVLSASEQLLWSLVCTSNVRVPKEGSCGDIGNGVMCHGTNSFGAIECRGGAIAGAQYCVAERSRCVQASPTDFHAVLDGGGKLVCR
jgi:Zn-dependent metalloprotease